MGGGVDAAELLGQRVAPFGLGAVGEEAVGLPAQRSSTEDQFVLGRQQGGAASIGSFSG